MINEEPNYWTRYFKKDHHKLRHDFSESENIECNWSQSMQDMFVLSMLDGKRKGVYVEIGADKPKIINNSYLLETDYDWTGVSFEFEPEKVEFFNDFRKNKCICADATQFDYKLFFQENSFPKQIDYLQLDIDPAEGTLAALKKLPLDDYRFSVITYETDIYNAGADIQDEEMRYLQSYGYQLVVKNVANEGNPYEDWWVDPNVVDRAIIDKFTNVSNWSKESPLCIFTDAQSHINAKVGFQ